MLLRLAAGSLIYILFKMHAQHMGIYSWAWEQLSSILHMILVQELL